MGTPLEIIRDYSKEVLNDIGGVIGYRLILGVTETEELWDACKEQEWEIRQLKTKGVPK